MYIITSGQVLNIDPGYVSGSYIQDADGTTEYLGDVSFDGATVVSGGFIQVDEGGSITNAIAAGGGGIGLGAGLSSDSILSSGGVEVVDGPGVAIGTVVSSGGVQEELDDGIARGTVVSSGGFEMVQGPGVASGTLVSGGGVQLDGGITIGTVISSGGTEVVSGDAQLGDISVASDTIVSSGGHLVVSSGGVAWDTSIAGGIAEFVNYLPYYKNEIVSFVGSSGEVRIDRAPNAPVVLSPGDTPGSEIIIEGFSAGDLIDLPNVNSVTSAYYSGGELVLTSDGSGSVYLDLVGQFANATFSASPDGNGGTEIAVVDQALNLSFSGPLIEGSDADLTLSATSAPSSNEQIQLVVSGGTASASEINGLPSSVTLTAGQTTATVPFDISQNPTATTNPETFTISATSSSGNESVTGDIEEFVTTPFVFTETGGQFTYNSSTDSMVGQGEINVAVSADPNTGLVSVQDATASYNASQFNVSGTVYVDVGGIEDPLFNGTFVLPYSGISTSSLTDDDALDGTFTLGGLDVDFEQLTFEAGTVLAGFSLSLPFTGGSLVLDTAPLGINYGLSFSSSGVALVLGASVSFPDAGPVNVFGLFTGSISDASLSYLADSDTLELQGTFTASDILGSSLTATADFSGDNYIDFQDGEPEFSGTLSLSGFSNKSGFGINAVSLSVNTEEETLSGEVNFTFPFGASAPEGDVTIKGSWADGPTVTEVDVDFSGLGIVVGDTGLIWQSAAVVVQNMFSATQAISFSGSLGFAFGPQLAGTSVGSLTLSVSKGSDTSLSGSATVELVPYSLASNLVGGALSSLQSIFPLLSSTDTLTANFAPGFSSFQSFSFVGTTSVLGGFITTNQSFTADANLDFTIAGQASVNFGNNIFGKISNYNVVANANYLISYTNGAPLANDYAEAWFNTSASFLGLVSANFTIGLKVDFDGTTSVLFSAPTTTSSASSSVKERAAPARDAASASGSQSSYLFLTANWANAASGTVSLTVTTPTGQVIQQSQFAANNIAVISDLSTAYSETVVVLDPSTTSGWSLGASSSNALGTVTVASALADTPPTVQSLSLASVKGEGALTVDYALANVSSGATLSFYADDDGQSFDGVLLGSVVSPSSGSSSDTLSLSGLGAGVWSIYALVSDGVSIPSEIYASGTVDITSTGVVATAPPLVDLLGDGQSDILLQSTTGAVVIGQTSGGQASYTQVGALGSGWVFEGVGDYLGGGEDQILLQNSAGAIVVGEVGSNNQEVYTQVGALGSGWSFDASGDFFGDGQDQFLIENSAGALVVGEVGSNDQAAYTQVGALGSGWTFHGAGDFLGDGKDQFLIENTSGALVLGEVGTSDLATYTQIGALGSTWTFEGVGDFLGDGLSDFLIESSNGAIVVGEVGSNDQITYTQVGALGSAWKFVGVGDYSGTGTDSFLIENASTGAVVTGTVQSGQAVYDQIGALGSEWSFPLSPSVTTSSPVRDDLLGDNLSDVVIQNGAGAVVIGEVGSGGQAAYTQVGAFGPEWTFEEIGDFLGGDQGQVLLENTAGAVVLAQVSNGQASYTEVSALGSGWAFEGAGDYFGDGRDQFLIENGSGALVVGEVGSSDQTTYTQVGALGSQWTFEGSGDLLGDGKDQFLIENTSGALVIGEVGANDQAAYTEVGALGPEWRFEGVGDFLDDSRDQFLIENTSGVVVVGEVGANGQASYTDVGALGSDWKFVGVGDYTGQGFDSFLIQSTTTGAVVTGTVVSGQAQYAQLGALGSEWSFKS